MNLYGFYNGELTDAYGYLGCHPTAEGAVFRTYAPGAERVGIIGEFSGWQELPMARVEDGNFWECNVPGAMPGMRYKYRITRNGGFTDHADPYGFAMECPPMSASVIQPLNGDCWTDQQWMNSRTTGKDRPVNVYEVHLGSWRKPSGKKWYTYREIAEPLVSYAAEKGYNYLELMPVGEHPSDSSWGYQQTGFFSPSARYGTPDDLRFLINLAHSRGIGVILDFVPVHFAVDSYGLADYDGSPIYEYPQPDLGMNEWGSKNFNHCRGEVRSFLQSCARYWLKEFHFDGLRIDALSNVIYWQGKKERGVNEGAVSFIKGLNSRVRQEFPAAILVAEDSTAFPGVTHPVEEGGLGFDYKWDMGWMYDTLHYCGQEPWERVANYHKLTFSMMYYWNEQYMLPLSHDEVVHGKGSIVRKMNGGYADKFAQARTLYMYMFAHPGKKLNFMGNELGQLREWEVGKQQDWNLDSDPFRAQFADYMKSLNHSYLNNPAFSQWDFDKRGFDWIDCHQEEKRMYLFIRRSQGQEILAVLNFSDCGQEYVLTQFWGKGLRVLLNSDEKRYGGRSELQAGQYLNWDHRGAPLYLNPFSGILLEVL